MLTRPPTAIALSPADVAELETLIQQRKKSTVGDVGEEEDMAKEEATKNDLAEKEERERRNKQARSRNERIGVAP